MKLRYKILLGVCTVATAAIIAVVFLPWKNMAEARMKGWLEDQGIHGVQFTLSDMDMRHAVFQDISADGAQLKKLVVRYSSGMRDITADAEDFRFKGAGLNGAAAKAAIRTKNMAGEWNIEELQLEAGSIVPPPMAGAGKLKYESGTFSLSGQFKSKDNAYSADFDLQYPSSRPQEGMLVLTSATMPWKGGMLMTKNVEVSLDGKQPTRPILQIKKVSLGALLQAMTGERVSATGTVTGKLPLTVGRDGSLLFGEGSLQADGAGILTMPPDAIPGDNQQVSMVRDIMKNFHYRALSITVRPDKGNKISLLVTLEGNNPDMYSGRPVKLNVRLAGDVLDYVRQNVLLLTFPETMLNQGQK